VSTQDLATGIGAARTLLFVPGDRPQRFAKAAAAGADGILLDLEDAVAAADKAAARDHVRRWLASGAVGAVRINAAGTPWHHDDLALVAEYGCPVMVPKAAPETLPDVVATLPDGTPVLPLIETAAGIQRAAEICAVDGVVRPAFGSVDLAAELGVAHDDQLALAAARSLLVLGAAAAGVAAPIDGVCTSIDDEGALIDELRHGRRLGMGGKLCIHPRQIEPIHRALAPTEDDLNRARRVVDAASAGSAVQVDGQMVDKPVLDRARALLARAG
jgi:citrate lyase subunit beta/citryl-CoA lyase